MSYLALLPAANVLLCVGLGLFTFLKGRRQPSNIGFALGLFCLALIEAGSALALAGPFQASNPSAGISLNLAGQALLPAFWGLFSAVFGRGGISNTPSRTISALAVMTLASFALAYYSRDPVFFDIYGIGEATGRAFFATTVYSLGDAGKYFYIFVILGLTYNLIQLENTLRSSSGGKRWHIKYVIIGVGGILAFYIVFSSQILLFSGLTVETLLLASAITFISVAMAGVFIVRNRLLDVDIFISRYVVYNSFTVLAVGIYLLAVGILVKGIRLYDLPLNNFLSILFIFISLFALILVLFTSTVRRKAQLFINRHFYRHKYEFRDKWMETIEKISPKREVEDVTSTLKELVSETVGARPVHIWQYEPMTSSFECPDAGLPEGLRSIGWEHPLPGCVKSSKGPFYLSEIKECAGESLLAGIGAVLCVPLSAGDGVAGFMLLGRDMSGEPYQADDFDILKAIATQAAVQIRNIRYGHDLMNMKTVEGFNRLSAFIMHDLKNLTNSLSLVSQNATHNMENPEFQRDAIKTIDATVNRMKAVIARLSAAPDGQLARFKETDLKSLLTGALGRCAFTESKDVSIRVEAGDLPLLRVDPEAMEMVILNLISNAFEALRGQGEISISAFLRDGAVNLTISDTGEGMTPEFIRDSLFTPFVTTKKSGFGIGLYQCRSIIEAHGGRIEVKSVPDKGTSFTISFPPGSPPLKS